MFIFKKNAVIKSTVRWKTDELEEYTGMQFAESVSVVRLAAPRTCFLCMTFLRRFRIEFMQVSTVQLSSEHRFLATSFCGNVQHQHRLPSINIMIRLINVMGKNVT